MALQKLVFKPGVNRDQTNYANEGGWYESNKVRFFSGFPQKIGGWTRYSNNRFAGACRALFNWVVTPSATRGNYLAIGTSAQIYVEFAGNLKNITPLQDPASPSKPISNITTVAGSSVITVDFSPAISPSVAAVGNYVCLSGITAAINGITTTTLNSTLGYAITEVVSVDSIKIDVGTVAGTSGSATPPSGTPVGYFEINAGDEYSATGYGWGIPSWGGSLTTPQTGWGVAALVPASSVLRLVYFDKSVDTLFFNIRYGDIYEFNIPAGGFSVTTRATLLADTTTPGAVVADIPTLVTQILFDSNANILMAFGCEPYGGPVAQDPLLIRWASQADRYNWAPSDDPGISTAGYLRIQNGSQILRAVSNANEILVFTESAITSVQYTASFPLLFAQRLISSDITVISANAVIVVNNVIYWMGHDKFFLYNGRVEPVPTTLREEVFGNIDYSQTEQFFACSNERFNEIWWFYTSGGGTSINRYVVYNYVENIWYYGDCTDGLVRTAWIDSSLRDFPQAAADDGYIYNQEDGVDADGEAISAYITSSDIDIEDGERFSLIRRIIPDINFNGSNYNLNPVVEMTLYPHNFPGQQYFETNQEGQNLSRPAISLLVNQYTEQMFVRTRARQIGIKISSVAEGTTWQLGAPRIEIRPDGTRGYNNPLTDIVYWYSNTTDGADTAVANVLTSEPPSAPLYFLDASNASSWPYSAGSAPTIANWTDISGASYFGYPTIMDVYNNPDLVTVSGSTKGLRMKATTGGTYPNGTAVEQRGTVNLGGDPVSPNGDVGTLLQTSKSYSISMWICFNQAPISGSGTGGTDMPTTIFAQYVNDLPYLILSSSRGDSVQPRYLNEIAVQYAVTTPTYPSPPLYANAVAGTWVPTVGVWYLVTIVAENTSSSSGNLSLYINDTSQGAATVTGSAYVPFNLPRANYYSYNFILNASYYPSASPNAFYYGGDITFSTFRIWDSALTASNIAYMFNNEKTPFGY